jgi:uncharacterized protein (DUF362 family)
MMIKKRYIQYFLFAAAITAICWDMAVSSLQIVPGTYRYESEFDALSGATTKVGIVTSDFAELSDPVERTIDPTYAQIEEMVGKAIELQGGFDYIIDTGDQVLIKVNLVGGNSASGNGENTDVRVVKALMRHIADYTEGNVEIIVAEGTARTNDDPADPNSVWGNSGYLDLLTDTDIADINFSLLNLNQSLEDLIEIDLGSKGTSAAQGSKYHVHKAEVEADVYITVPVLKIHDTGITNALKLQVGSAPGCYYGYNKMGGTALCPTGLIHGVAHRLWTSEAIVDLSNIADIDFVLVDAIMCLETEKVDRVYNRVRFNTVFAGADPVAIDHVGAKLMGLNPDDIAHITLAEKVGLGTNNPDHIVIEGVPIEQAKKKVKKNQTADGKFGQSNRTWILSQAFEGTDIAAEYYLNEASIQPIPGDNGWSQPVYFFDDRIDLLSYYAGAINMVSYAFAYFDALQDQEAELWLGSQEAMYVYLNGEKVYSFTSTSTYGNNDRGEYKNKVNIKQGRNTLLVKTLNKFGDYSFALNICEVEPDPLYFGNRVEGLKFYIDESGTGSELNTSAVKDLSGGSTLNGYPNPATEYVKISFELPGTVNARVNIYDLNGRLVKSLCHERLSAGVHEFTWMLDDDTGGPVSKGIYFCKLESGSQHNSIKLLVD